MTPSSTEEAREIGGTRAGVPQPLLWIAALAVVLRVGASVAVSDFREPRTWESGRIAEYLVGGQGYAFDWVRDAEGKPTPSALMAPGYVFFLAAFYALLGLPGAYGPIYMTQALLAGLACLALARAADATLGRRPALIAALLFALAPNLIYISTQIIQTNAVIWTVPLLLWAWAVHRNSKPWLVGIAAGIAILCEPPTVVLFACLAVGMVLEGRTERSRPAWRRALVAAGVAALVLSPWQIRNQLVLGRFVFVKSVGGFNFWIGNNPHASGTLFLRPFTGTPRKMVSTFPRELKHAATSEVELDRLYLREALRWVRANPAAFVLKAPRVFWYFLWWSPDYEKNHPGRPPLWPLKVYWGVCLLLGLLALVRHYDRARPFLPAIAGVVLLGCFYAFVFVLPRYRVPFELVWFCLAALPVERVLSSVQARA